MKILLISPHTDDVELGCGGSVVKLLEAGNEILWVVFSAADESLPQDLPKGTLVEEFTSVINHLGMNDKSYKIFNYKVRGIDKHRQEVLEDLIKIRGEFKPDLVIGPSLNDLHQDHKVVASEMVRAFKATSSIICYELPWNHITFNTQLFTRLSKQHIVKKCEILKNYRSQIQIGRDYFSEEYVFGLAKVRGIQCNYEYAEAFEVIRWMI